MEKRIVGPLLSVIIPVCNGAAVLERCLTAVFASSYTRFECIVVDDGSTDTSVETARRFPVRILSVRKGPRGPAYARNLGADVARGDILFFIDADVCVHPDTLATAVAVYQREPEVAAVFGSYDDHPESLNLISQYKNLFHHFVHQQACEDGATFWSGCGSVRRAVFEDLHGFDHLRYPRPSIEDIDLGYRLKAAGHVIRLSKATQATHLKRWTLRTMVASDLFDRGIPWTLLGLDAHNLPDDLNLQFSQRLSAALACLALGGVATALTVDPRSALLLVLLACLSLVLVAYWPWPDDRRRVVSRAGTCAMLCIGGLSIAAALVFDQRLAAILVAPVALGLLAHRRELDVAGLGGPVGFAVAVLALSTAIVLDLFEFPRSEGGLIAVCVAVILLLNWRLYVFFVQRRGWVFALSAIPLHLFYYLYSVLAFVIAATMRLSRYRVLDFKRHRGLV